MTNLETLLKQIDQESAVPAPEPDREAELMRAFDASRAGTRSRVSFVTATALTATVAVVTAAGLTLFRNADDTARQNAPAAATESGGFYLWPGAESLPQFESGQLVRMELPDLGVRADVLIGQDGLPRAYRVLTAAQENQR